MKLTRVKQLLRKFKDQKVVVLGDLILDEYQYGTTTRISREAPVLILKHQRSELMPGGGANPVANIHSLGGHALPVGVVGADSAADKLMGLFKRRGIDTRGVTTAPGRPTLRKIRIMAGGHNTARQQVVRMDFVTEERINKTVERQVLKTLADRLAGADALLVSDYGSGLITPAILKYINSLGHKRPRLVVCVDSRYQLTSYRHIWSATPNETEAAPAAGYEEYREEVLDKIGARLLSTLKSRMVLVTRGSKGMTLFQKRGKPVNIPAYGSQKIVDVNGAGDTVASVMSLALASGATPAEAMHLANAAGGVAVMKAGPVSVNQKQLLGMIGRYL